MHCVECGHEWTGKLLVHVPLNDAAAYMRGLRCPQCGAGSKKLYLRLTPPESSSLPAACP